MGNNIRTYEVRVEVEKKGSSHFSSHVGKHIQNKIIKMFHVDARTHEQAMQKVEKRGRPISARKVNVEEMGINIENLLLREPYGAKNPYPDAIAMDEMVWRKKNKRAERIGYRGKDREGY